MYILISIFVIYAMGIISYEYGILSYYFTAVFVLLIYNSLKTKRIIYNLVIISFIALSFINCYYNSISVLAQYIKVSEELEIIAKVKTQNKSNSSSNSNYIGYNASVISINQDFLSEEENTIVYINRDNIVNENSIIKFNGSIADSNFSKNKMLFDYNNYLRSKKISFVVFAQGDINVIKNEYSLLNNISLRFREYTENTFYKHLNVENANIILSIILGDTDYLNEDLYENIKLMGLAHVFAVSGSHIVIMYGVLLFGLKFCGLSHKISWMITWVIIWFYGLLIGFPLSVMRTLVMFTLLFGSELFYRKYSSLNSIGLAALVLTIYNPYWIYDAGFLLSFSAALSLILYNMYIVKHVTTENVILRNIYMYIFLQLFTLPVLSYYFNYIPIMGILYNLLLLPIFTVILIYSFVLLILNFIISSGLILLFNLLDYMLYTLRYIIVLTDQIDFNGVVVPTMSKSLSMFYYIMLTFMIYLYNNKRSVIRKCGIMTLVSFYAINFVIIPFNDDSLYFNVADAGQGIFTTLKYKNTSLIFDCGSTSSQNFGMYTVVPYLIKRGITNVDGVFISHWDEDHYSGLTDLLNSNVKVEKIFSTSNNEGINKGISVLKGNSIFNLDEDFKIKILWPKEQFISTNKNNTSLVILIEYDNQRILLTGDIEKEVEDLLLNNLVQANILIVPHHGSKTSSSSAFVEKVRPNIAVFSYGKNSYGIPSKDVISRYEQEKSIVLTTFKQGEINFILKGNKIYYNTYTNEKSDNYYELYFVGMIPNIINFIILLYLIDKNKGVYDELQNNN